MIAEAARLARMATSTLVLALAARFTSWEILTPQVVDPRNPKPPSAAPKDALSALAESAPPRIDLEKLEELAGSKLSNPDLEPQKKEPKPETRRLLVDIGPPRSVVYVNGVRKGQTPYGGQVSCVEGDELTVEVLPPSGAPLRRVLPCGRAILNLADADDE